MRHLGYRREHVEASLQRAGLSPALSREIYARLGAHALELLFGVSPRLQLGATLAEAIARTQGQPKVVCASHTGNWEAALRGMTAHLPLSVIVKRQSQAWAERLLQRRRVDMELIAPEGSMLAGLRALGAGRTVVALSDQAPLVVSTAVSDRFMGQRCWSDKSPAQLAANARCPLWVVAQWMDLEQVRVELLGCFEPKAPRRAWVEQTTRQASALLEAHVRAHPADWLWTHRRWKELDSSSYARSTP